MLNSDLKTTERCDFFDITLFKNRSRRNFHEKKSSIAGIHLPLMALAGGSSAQGALVKADVFLSNALAKQDRKFQPEADISVSVARYCEAVRLIHLPSINCHGIRDSLSTSYRRPTCKILIKSPLLHRT